MCLLANVVKLQGYATRGDTSAGGGRRGGATFCLFFFQAEDGIRDTSVTGVQTCALPISPIRGAIRTTPSVRSHPGSGERTKLSGVIRAWSRHTRLRPGPNRSIRNPLQSSRSNSSARKDRKSVV